jgi:hypothetical protein
MFAYSSDQDRTRVREESPRSSRTPRADSPSWCLTIRHARDGSQRSLWTTRSWEGRPCPGPTVSKYDANDRVKLSYHADGFVQFSGENSTKIQSGRDGRGLPKGIGLQTAPISSPIKTGPTFGIACWGLSDFREDEAPSANDIVFEEHELYHRDCTPSNFNAYQVFGFVFPESLWGVVRMRGGGGYSLHVARPELLGVQWSGALSSCRISLHSSVCPRVVIGSTSRPSPDSVLMGRGRSESMGTCLWPFIQGLSAERRSRLTVPHELEETRPQAVRCHLIMPTTLRSRLDALAAR